MVKLYDGGVYLVNGAEIVPESESEKAVEIREGMQADLTVFRIDEGSFNYLDSKKENREFSERAAAVYTCLGSKVYLCRT